MKTLIFATSLILLTTSCSQQPHKTSCARKPAACSTMCAHICPHTLRMPQPCPHQACHGTDQRFACCNHDGLLVMDEMDA